MDVGSLVWPLGSPAHLNVSKAALANLSQSLNTTHEEVALAVTYEGSHLKESIISAALLTLFFGMSHGNICEEPPSDESLTAHRALHRPHHGSDVYSLVRAAYAAYDVSTAFANRLQFERHQTDRDCSHARRHRRHVDVDSLRLDRNSRGRSGGLYSPTRPHFAKSTPDDRHAELHQYSARLRRDFELLTTSTADEYPGLSGTRTRHSELYKYRSVDSQRECLARNDSLPMTILL